MSQSIHTGSSRQTGRHRSHHFRIDERNHRDIVDIDTDEFTRVLRVGNDIVDSDFGSRTSRCRDSQDRRARILGRSDAFQRTDIRKFRVGVDDTDRFRGIHRRASADRDDAVCTCFRKCLDTGLDVFDRRVRLDVGIDDISDSCFIQEIGHFGSHAEFDQIRVGSNECFLETAGFDFIGDLFDRTFTVVRSFI